MTPSKKAKHLGCDSLAQVITVSGVPRSTLADWYESRPFVFAAVCEKVAAREAAKRSSPVDVELFNKPWREQPAMDISNLDQLIKESNNE